MRAECVGEGRGGRWEEREVCMYILVSGEVSEGEKFRLTTQNLESSSPSTCNTPPHTQVHRYR